MSSYLDKTGLERVWSKATNKFATNVDTDELRGRILNLETNSATKQEVSDEVAQLVDSAPSTLNTLNELAAALGDDPNFATTVATEIGKKVNISDYNDVIGSINSHISTINGEIDELQEASEKHLNKEDYLGPIIKEGNPIVYDNGVEGFDIKVETTFGPKQAGSGDPYPVGGGKNLFYVAPRTTGGITVSKNADGSYALNGTATSIQMIQTNCSYSEGTYILSSQSLPQGVYVRIRDAAGTILATNNIESTLVHKFIGTPGICEFTIASGASLDNVIIKPQLEKSETATDWEPCENIRAITGYDEFTLNHTGKNLFPAPDAETSIVSAGVTFTRKTDGSIVINGTPTAVSVLYLPLPCTIPAGTSVALSLNNPTVAGNDTPSNMIGIRLVDRYPYNSEMVFGAVYARAEKVNAKAVVSEAFAAKGIQVRVGKDTGTITNFVIKPQIEIGSVATDFTAYNDKKYSVPLSETVYGGCFGWTTGKLSKEYSYVSIDGNAYLADLSVRNNTVRVVYYLSQPAVDGADTQKVMCDTIPFRLYTWSDTNDYIGTYILVGYPTILVLSLPRSFYGDTLETIKAKLAERPIQIAYKLAEPIEAQLTPAQISELEGINTLYGDGDSIRAIFKSTGGTSTTLETISGILPVEKGGTGATSAAGARSNLGITPANIGAIATTGGTIKGNLTFGEYSKGTGALYLNILRTVNDVDYRMRLYVNGSTGAASIQSHCGSDEVNHMYLKADATEFKMPVAIGSGGTGATTASDARKNLGVLALSGGTLTGTLNIGLETNTANNYFNINRTLNNIVYTTRVYNASTDGSACVSLINNESGSATTINRMRLSSTETSFMKPVNIASGGTGATTAAQARTNLGITPANIGALSLANGVNLTNAGTKIENGTDLNNIKTPGQYYVSGASSAASMLNGPTVNFGYRVLVVQGYDSGIIHQQAFGWTNDIFVRTCASGTWNEWNTLLTPTTINVTNTTPSSATTYYPLYTTGTSGNQTARANTDFYYYDIGTTSYLNVGSSSHIGGLTLHYSNGYYSSIVTDTGLTANREVKLPNASGTILTTGNYPALTSCTGTLTVAKGGTGATDAATARSNLGITPANIGALSTNGGTVTGSIAVIRTDTNYAYIDIKNEIDGVEHMGGFTVGEDKTFYFRLTANGTSLNSLSLTPTATSLGKPLTVSSGGTGAISKSGARTNLGITSGTTLPSSASAGDIFFLYS